MKKKTKQIMMLALLLMSTVSLLASSLPGLFENKSGNQFYKEMDVALVKGGSDTIKYVGPPAPERYDVNIKPPYDHQEPIMKFTRIIFGFSEDIRSLQVDFYYI